MRDGTINVMSKATDTPKEIAASVERVPVVEIPEPEGWAYTGYLGRPPTKWAGIYDTREEALLMARSSFRRTENIRLLRITPALPSSETVSELVAAAKVICDEFRVLRKPHQIAMVGALEAVLARMEEKG